MGRALILINRFDPFHGSNNGHHFVGQELEEQDDVYPFTRYDSNNEGDK